MQIKRYRILFIGLLFIVFEASSSNKIDVAQNVPEGEPKKEINATYKVVAHRGGYLECDLPDFP